MPKHNSNPYFQYKPEELEEEIALTEAEINKLQEGATMQTSQPDNEARSDTPIEETDITVRGGPYNGWDREQLEDGIEDVKEQLRALGADPDATVTKSKGGAKSKRVGKAKQRAKRGKKAKSVRFAEMDEDEDEGSDGEYLG